jgi:PAS domain S-box-containing protein
MTPAEIATLAAAAGALLTAGATALRLRLDRRKSTGDLEISAAAAYKSLLSEVDGLRLRLDVAEERARKAEEHGRRCDVEVAQLRDELTALRAAFPAAAVALRLQSLTADLYDVLDKLSPLVLSSPADEGRLVFVNLQFAQALGRSRDEILNSGWRALIHPDDLASATGAEAAAWDRAVRTVNRYRHADGTYRVLRWWASRYLQGVAVSAVRFEAAVLEDCSPVAADQKGATA